MYFHPPLILLTILTLFRVLKAPFNKFFISFDIQYNNTGHRDTLNIHITSFLKRSSNSQLKIFGQWNLNKWSCSHWAIKHTIWTKVYYKDRNKLNTHDIYFHCALKSSSSGVSVFHVALPECADALSAMLWKKRRV